MRGVTRGWGDWLAACHKSARVPSLALVSRAPFLYALCFGIVGLTFKQLRDSRNVGPAEILVLLLAGLVFLSGVWKATEVRLALKAATGIFLLLSLGTLFSLVVAPARLDVREMIAYPYSFLVIITFMAAASGREREAVRVMAEVIGFSLLATAACAPLPSSQFQQILWYVDRTGGLRLRGLSDNPNQIGFLAVAGLGLLFLEARNAGARRTPLLIAGLGCLAAGAMARSRAFTLCLVTMVVVIAASQISIRLRSHSQKMSSARTQHATASLTPPETFVVLAILLMTLAVPDRFLRALPSVDLTEQHWGANFFAAPDVAPKTVNVGPVVVAGDERMVLWPRAIQTAARSPLVGLGMGAHVVLPPRAFAQEAHNTILDLLLVAGVAGVVPLLALGATILIKARAVGRLGVVLLAGTPMAAFAMVHFVGRQPLFWILQFACACDVGWVGSRKTSSEMDADPRAGHNGPLQVEGRVKKGRPSLDALP